MSAASPAAISSRRMAFIVTPRGPCRAAFSPTKQSVWIPEIQFRNSAPYNEASMLTIEKYSVGVGDRFAHQAKAQLQACAMAAQRGVTVIPVWNKSNREHGIVGSEPASVRAAADEAVRQSGWTLPYHVDADHINLSTVDR